MDGLSDIQLRAVQAKSCLAPPQDIMTESTLVSVVLAMCGRREHGSRRSSHPSREMGGGNESILDRKISELVAFEGFITSLLVRQLRLQD